MEEKVCNKCNLSKYLSEFYFRKDINKHRNSCISCEKNRLKVYYDENTDSRKKSSANYYKKNKEECDRKYAEFRKTDKRKNYTKEYNKKYILKNKKILNLKSKKRKEKDVLFKIRCNIRSLISCYFKKKNYNKSKKTIEILGCSIPDFQKHIELQFESWMNWENHGKYNPDGIRTWQLDHIIPVSTAKNEQEMILLNHFSNFRPLCSKENNFKSNKIL